MEAENGDHDVSESLMSRRTAAVYLSLGGAGSAAIVLVGMLSGTERHGDDGQAWDSLIKTQLILGGVELLLLAARWVPMRRLWSGAPGAERLTAGWLILCVCVGFAWLVARIGVGSS